jgi:hypothetical protein
MPILFQFFKRFALTEYPGNFPEPADIPALIYPILKRKMS